MSLALMVWDLWCFEDLEEKNIVLSVGAALLAAQNKRSYWWPALISCAFCKV